MIDSHIHLSYKYFDQTFPYIKMDSGNFVIGNGSRQSLIEEMKDHGISCCIEPAIDVGSNALLLQLSREYGGFVYPAVGNHPTRCTKSSCRDFRLVREYAGEKGVVAIGETGLDYHYQRRMQHRIRQKIWFQWQIDLAHQHGYPLILHVRMADDDAIRILRRNRRKLHGGVCHCFGRGPKTAKIYTEELGFHLGIGGTLLMEPEISEPLQRTVKMVPIECLMLETDGPYVRPEKPDTITGKKWAKARNTSLILPAVVNKIAELKNMTAEDVIRMTDENVRRVFGIR